MLHSLNGSAPVVNTRPVRTRDYSVELQRSGPAALPAIYHNFHLVTVFLADETTVVRERAAGCLRIRFMRGEISVRAAGPATRVEWPAGAHCLHVHLHPRLIREIGRASGAAGPLGLETRPRLRDPAIRDIGFELNEIIGRRAPIDPSCVHELVLALAHRVFATCGAPAVPPVRIGTLSVEDVLDAFRDDAGSWQGVARLAERAGLTRSHFSRQVRTVTGLAPYAMVLGSRIEAAKNLLERGGLPLSHVAYHAGFADQSHLTRVFRRATGTTPARYRAAQQARARI